MADIRPTLNKIGAFDAKIGTTISFSWLGSQSQKNRVIIREYETDTVVYDCTQTTMALKHTLHVTTDTTDLIDQKVPYALVNGGRYYACVYSYDIYDNESQPSNDVTFYCFSTPTFEFTNFTNINASTGIALVTYNSVYLNVIYQQEEGETLDEYRFTLYDHSGNLLVQSNAYYGSSDNDVLSYTLGGVDDTATDSSGNLDYNTYYTVMCSAVTVHGMEISTDQKFVVQRETTGVGALINLEKLADNTIAISSNFKITNAEMNGEEVYMTDDDGNEFALDLTSGDELTYFDGFEINDPWSVTAIVGNCQHNSTLMILQNNNGECITLTYNVEEYPDLKKAYFLLEASRQTTHFILRSKYLPVTRKWYVVYIKYDSGYYTLQIHDPEEYNYETIEIHDDDEDPYIDPDAYSCEVGNVYATDYDGHGIYYAEHRTTIDFDSLFDFKDLTYYEVTFDCSTWVKNWYGDFLLDSVTSVSLDSNVEASIYDNTCTIRFFYTSDGIQPTADVIWNNLLAVGSDFDFYVSKICYTISNMEVNEMVVGADYDPYVVDMENAMPTEVGTQEITQTYVMDISDYIYYVRGWGYVIKFSFANEVFDGHNAVITPTEECTVTYNGTTFTGTDFEYAFDCSTENRLPQEFTISWTNTVECDSLDGATSAYSAAIIYNMMAPDVSHPDPLFDQTYDYEFHHAVNTEIGQYVNSYSDDIELDDLDLTDGTSYTATFSLWNLHDLYYGFTKDDSVVVTENDDNDGYIELAVNFDGETYPMVAQGTGAPVSASVVINGTETKVNMQETNSFTFTYTEGMTITIKWDQTCTNQIESEYSKGDSYILVKDFTIK